MSRGKLCWINVEQGFRDVPIQDCNKAVEATGEGHGDTAPFPGIFSVSVPLSQEVRTTFILFFNILLSTFCPLN